MPHNTPSTSAANPFLDREDVLVAIRRAFANRDQLYPQHRAELKKRLEPLAVELDQLQANGHPMICADQIRLEAQWLLNYRDDWERASRRLDDLERSLADTARLGPIQDEDGSWGRCCTEWYRKLEPTVDALQGNLQGALKPLLFMQKLQDPSRTLNYLYQLQISDIETTGINNRDELGAVQSALSQLIFKDQLRDLLANRSLGFGISPELEACYIDYLEQTQHPRTGFWGPWYRFGDRLIMVQDLSFTFHMIQYRSGNISKWPLVIDSTLAIRDLVYPAGWRPSVEVQYNNHNNYDVVSIFYFGWPHMSAQQKLCARQAIKSMLDWCLTKSLGDEEFSPDGGSILDAYYFGIRFLDRVGFWDPSKRFWLHKLPDAPAGTPTPHDLCKRLQRGFAKLKDASEEGETVRDLLRVAECVSSLGESSRA